MQRQRSTVLATVLAFLLALLLLQLWLMVGAEHAFAEGDWSVAIVAAATTSLVRRLPG
jgi:uncharacterized protein DUF6755